MISTIQKPSMTKTSQHPSTFFPDLGRCRTMRDLKQLHANFIKTRRIHDPLASAELLRLSALSDPPLHDLAYARHLLGRMQKPNCFSWNTIIRAFSESDDPFEALVLFRQMLDHHFTEPNRFTFPSLLKACCRTNGLDEGKQIHGLIVKYGLQNDEFVLSNLVRMYVMSGLMNDAYILFNASMREMKTEPSNVVLWNVMVDGFIRIGEFEGARQLFDKIPHRSMVSWNSIISGYAQNGFFKEALQLFRQMQIEGLSPNYVTLVSILPAISHLGALELGKWAHLYAEKNKFTVDKVLGSALIDMYSKCGSIEKALQVFDKIPQKNVITWNAIIGGLAMHGRARDAIHYFSEMKNTGISPSDVTYISLLTACSHAGLVQEGKSIFNHMISRMQLRPNIEHYSCMVDLYGRAGLLQEAKDLIHQMPIKPDDVILKALMGACKLHKNIDMGKQVAKLLIEMVPRDSGSYVALSNMYASSQKWDAVSEVRLMMKEMDIRKDPGCSWIEIDGSIHEFLVEDSTHPKGKEIYIMLEEMSRELSYVGYEPITSQVLLKVDDSKDKITSLHCHSEKIAVAFGLISTRPNMPIRVVKNLRICDDCHSSFKLFSKIYEREIMVRDRKRFHRFKDGLCSCMDYW